MQDFINNLDRRQFIKMVGYYFVVIGLLTLCGGILLITVGGLAGIGGAAGLGALREAGSVEGSSEAQAAAAGVLALGGFVAVLGVIYILLGPAQVVVGWGLLKRAPWARMGAVIVGAISVIGSILSFLTGRATALELIYIVMGLFIVYMFYSDARTRAEFTG